MCYQYVWPESTAKYRAKPRTYVLPDGSQLKVRLTRYTYESFYKPCKGPRGGRAVRKCYRSVWWDGEKFWRAKRVELSPDETLDTVVPMDGVFWDRYPKQSLSEGVPDCTVCCKDGLPYRVDAKDWGTIWQVGDDMGELAEWLHLPDVA